LSVNVQLTSDEQSPIAGGRVVFENAQGELWREGAIDAQAAGLSRRQLDGTGCRIIKRRIGKIRVR
jgi:hypothetical protein